MSRQPRIRWRAHHGEPPTPPFPWWGLVIMQPGARQPIPACRKNLPSIMASRLSQPGCTWKISTTAARTHTIALISSRYTAPIPPQLSPMSLPQPILPTLPCSVLSLRGLMSHQILAIHSIFCSRATKHPSAIQFCARSTWPQELSQSFLGGSRSNLMMRP